jgi:cytochrome P450
MPTPIPTLPLPNDFRTLARVIKNPSAFLLDLSCMAGDIAQLRAGPAHIVCINRPDLVHAILVEQAKQFRKMPAVKTLKVFTGDGLLVNESDVWAKHRKLAAPAFHHQRIAAYQRVVAESVVEVMNSWRDDQLLDLERTFKDLTLRIIARALFSVELDDVARGLGHDIDTALNYVNKLAGMSVFPLGGALVPNARAGRAAIARVDVAIRGIIAQRRAAPSDRGDLLSMFLESRTVDGQALSDDEVRDEVITMFVAGHETVATVLTWLIYRVSQDAALQHRLAEEARSVLRGAAPEIDELPSLPLTLNTYKEAMRLYPGGFTIGRQATANVALGEFEIEAGTWVMVSPYSVQRNPVIFAEPLNFIPDRFTGDAERGWPKGAYLPFGLGARACIGAQFALMEGHTIAAALLRAAEFSDETPKPAQVRPMIALSPDRVIAMRVHRRA